MPENIYKKVCERLMQVDHTTPLSLCCLCLKSVGEGDSSVDDEVVLSFHTGGRPVARKISNILKVLIDENFSQVMYMLKSVCKQCLNTAIAGYKLIQNCKINSKILYEAVENLEQSLSDLPTDMYDCKSLYVSINQTEIAENCVIKRYFDKKKHFIPQDTALPRFNIMLKYLYPKIRICCKSNVDTTDILYDPKKPNEYKCVICQTVFANSTCLRIHFFREHHHGKDVKCKECDKLSDQMPHLDVHENTDIELQHDYQLNKEELSREGIQFQDDIECFDIVDTPAVESEVIATSDTVQLNQHTETEPEYTCSNCKLSFKDLYWYNEHTRLKSNCKGSEKGRFCCDYCGRCYTYKRHVEAHILCAHMGKGTPCEYCGKRFMNPSGLQQHLRKHNKRSTAMCIECGKTFVDENYLKHHMRIHTGERPYQCEICYKTFTLPNTYASHVDSHKPKIKCKFCHKMFKRGAMRPHVRRFHFANITSSLSDKKTYSCTYCNTSVVFINRYELQCHINKEHLALVHLCNICTKKFKTKSSLNRHKKLHLDIRNKLYVPNISV